MTTREDFMYSVQQSITKKGVLCVVQQHALWIFIDSTTAIVTGDAGWDYGTIYRVIGGKWEPDYDTVPEIAAGNEDNVRKLANEWTDFVHGWRANA